MKATKLLLLTLTCGLTSMSAGSVSDIQQLRSAKVFELPSRVEALIADADKSSQLVTAARAIKTAVESKPQMAPTIVSAVATSHPHLAADAALIAAQSNPSNVRYIAAAAITAAPKQTREIVAKLTKALPKKANDIFIAASYKRTSEIRGLGIIGLRDADPKIFGAENEEIAATLTPTLAAALPDIGDLIGADAQVFNTSIVVIGLSLNVVNSIVSAIATSGAVTQQNFATLVQSVINKAATADSGTAAKTILKNTLTDLGVSEEQANTISDNAANDGGPVQVAVQNSQNIVELVTVTVQINTATKRSYSGTIRRN